MNKFLNEIKQNSTVLSHLCSDKDIYVLFYFASNVYTGVIRNQKWVLYAEKETDVKENDIFFSGHIFNEDFQIDISIDENTDKIVCSLIPEEKLSNLMFIDESMFLLSDDKSYEIHDQYTKLVQGLKTVIVPKKFDKAQVKKGITLKVRNYISFDENDFPFVSYVRFLDFCPFEEEQGDGK